MEPHSDNTKKFRWAAFPAITQLLKVGKQPLSLQLGYRYYADSAQGGPDWGLRFAVTLLFPK